MLFIYSMQLEVLFALGTVERNIDLKFCTFALRFPFQFRRIAGPFVQKDKRSNNTRVLYAAFK